MKRKIVARVIATLLLFLIPCSLTGCFQKYEIEEGFDYTFTPEQIMFGIKAKSDTFKQENVSFDLHYSFFNMDESPDARSASYKKEHDEKIVFCLYVTDQLLHSLPNPITNYTALEGLLFVKSISEENAFSDEYGNSIGYLRGVTFNHCESFTVPKDFFSEQEGEVVLEILAFSIPSSEQSGYEIRGGGSLLIEYETTENGCIKFNDIEQY